MTDEEIALNIGSIVVDNWQYLLGGLISFVGLVGAGVWFVSSLLYKKEIRLQEIGVQHANERFSQFETIMEQKVEVLVLELEKLKEKLNEANQLDSEARKLNFDEIGDITPPLLETIGVGEPRPSYGFPAREGSLLTKLDKLSGVINQISVGIL